MLNFGKKSLMLNDYAHKFLAYGGILLGVFIIWKFYLSQYFFENLSFDEVPVQSRKISFGGILLDCIFYLKSPSLLPLIPESFENMLCFDPFFLSFLFN